MRSNSKLLASVFATTALGAALAATPALALPSFTCSGEEIIPAGVYSSVSMPAGSLCGVFGSVTILSPLKLGDGAGLGVRSGGSLTIQGPVTIGPGAVFGNVGNSNPININGPVNVGSNGALIVGVESPYAPIVSAIRGPITAQDASTVQIHNTQISGPVKIDGGGGDNAIVDRFFGPGSNFNDLEDNQIHGPVSETGYDGIWAGVIRNKIYGPLTFTDNAEPPLPPGSEFVNEYDIGSNLIFGPATCDDNNPAPNMGPSSGSPSIVHGPVRGDQAATCTGTPEGETGLPV